MAPGGRTFVKICGITSLADARLAIRAGANALGFVFAGGPRRMTPTSVAEITSRIHPTVRRIGVFVDPDPDVVVDIVERASLDGVQLHGTEPRALIEAIRALAPRLFLVKAIRVGGPQTIDDGIALRRDGLVDAVMLDTKDPADVDARRPSIATAVAIDAEGPAIDRIVLAGGLTPENVAPLVRGVRPWGVDVSSGVEAEPGRKDPDRLRAFVRAVREAERA